jgi:hypothetical protein
MIQKLRYIITCVNDTAKTLKETNFDFEQNILNKYSEFVIGKMS